ncbi:MAG: CDP-diacylglycerol--glycerol-3-phosphate 3-phosphatidyltransferase [Clostridiales bacterium]|jgi:CDP-diacylglycerol--glycerol-3-phosphate 3-phosphatidyltransferase|nr:CDP-diacylglycerol--glycerol-3-phosphate 3-phosphatidyltransferase [Clostridiales bacterium]
MNTANKLTLLRVVIIPFFVFFALTGRNLIAGVLFAAASATDFLDGYVARKYNQVTTFGKFSDPLADKLLVMAALVILSDNEIPSFMVIIMIAREFIVTGLRLVAAEKRVVIAADMHGKVKTAVQMIMILWVFFIGANNGYSLCADYTGAQLALKTAMDLITAGLVWLSAILSVTSGAHYLYKNRKIFKEGENDR